MLMETDSEHSHPMWRIHCQTQTEFQKTTDFLSPFEMALELALSVAAIIAAAIMVAHLVFKALQSGRSYRQLLGEEVEDVEAAEEPQPQWRIPLALTTLFYLLIIAECLLLAHQEPTWVELGKAAVGISCSFYQANFAPWNPKTLTRVLVSLPLNMWMLTFPFLQCQWWLFGVSTATCTVCAVLLHLGDLDDELFSIFSASLIAAWLAAQAMVGTWTLGSLSFAGCAAGIGTLFYSESFLHRYIGLISFYCIVFMAGVVVLLGQQALWGGGPFVAMVTTQTLVLSQALAPQALALPAIPGLLLVQGALKALENGITGAPFNAALLGPYLVWSILLPFLTFTSGPLLAVTEVAAFAGAALSNVWLVRRWSNQEDVPLPFVAPYGILLLVATVLPLGVVWWSGGMPHLLETVPPWMFSFVPGAVGVIYLLAEVVFNYVPPGDERAKPFERSDIVTRVLVLLVLLVTPWALALDTAELQQWAMAPDMFPADFVTLQFWPNETWKDIKTWHFPNTNWHSPKQEFLTMPRPPWPKLANINGMLARAKFWIPFMATKLFGAIFLAILVLRVPCRKVQVQRKESIEGVGNENSSEGVDGVGDDSASGSLSESAEGVKHGSASGSISESAEGVGEESVSERQLTDVQRNSLTILLVVANLALCTKLTLAASMAGQLTSGGMVWEAFDEILSWGLLWFMAQATALRVLNCSASYPSFDVALSILFLFPYLGDPVDTLKDAMLAANAIHSDLVWLRLLGIAGLIYLWVLHLFILLPVQSSRLELQSSYLPVLLLKPGKTASKFVHGWSVKLCAELYKQTTPTRQKGMLAEDLPQALLACIVAISVKGGLFTVFTNVLMPVVRLSFAYRFHDWLAETVQDWLLQQAGVTVASGRFAQSNELTLAMWKLQSRLSKDQLWSEDHMLEVKDMVQKHLDERGCPSWLIVQFALLQLTEISEELVQKALTQMFFEASEDSLLQKSFCKWSSQLSTRFGRFHGSFSGSTFGSKQCDFLGKFLSGMTAITELRLDLDHCNITTDGFSAIAAGIAKAPVPGSPSGNVATCWPSGAFGLFLPKPHGTGPGLRKLHLDLGYNQIAGTRDLIACLTEHQELVALRLRLTSNVTGPAAQDALRKAAAKLPRLAETEIEFRK